MNEDIKLGSSVWNIGMKQLGNSVLNRASVIDSKNFICNSIWKSDNSVKNSVWNSIRNSVLDSVWNSVYSVSSHILAYCTKSY